MTPRQYEQQFGRPVLQKVTVQVGQTVEIPSDPDRYLIIFVTAIGSCSLHFGSDPELQFGGLALPTADMPLTFTFALHPGIPGMAFTLEGVDPQSTVTYLVGRAQPILVRPPQPGLYRATPNPGESPSLSRCGNRILRGQPEASRPHNLRGLRR